MYYYKVKKKHPLHLAFTQFMERVKAVKDEARALAIELSDSETFYSRPHTLAGGIGALIFKEKPEGWKQVGEKWQRAFYPKASNKSVCKRIESLPVILADEMNAIIGFEAGTSSEEPNQPGIVWYGSFGLKEGKGKQFLINVPNGMSFKPVDGMVEITNSEYTSLLISDKNS